MNAWKNMSGHETRKPSDNKVVDWPGKPLVYPARYKNVTIEFRKEQTPTGRERDVWIADGKPVGSISNLSKKLGLNVETHEIGLWLQRRGYRFVKYFEDPMKP